jgi:hypothetical protein
MTFGKIILAVERVTVLKRPTESTQVGRKAVAIDNIRLLKTHCMVGFGSWNAHRSSDELHLMHLAQMPGPAESGPVRSSPANAINGPDAKQNKQRKARAKGDVLEEYVLERCFMTGTWRGTRE